MGVLLPFFFIILQSPVHSFPSSFSSPLSSLSLSFRISLVAGLVESIRKHKKFKQLASYSIQCLEKVVAPPRIGWEICAKQAYELNAAEDIADVCERFAADPEVFALSMSSLNALATVPRAVATMLRTSTAGLIIKAIKGYFTALDFTQTGGLTDNVEKLLASLKLLTNFARTDPVAFDTVGGIQLLLDIATMTQGRGIGPGAYTVIAPVVTASAIALDRLSRNKGGLDALLKPNIVTLLIQLATTNLNPPEAKGDRKSLKRMSTMLARSKSMRQMAKGGSSSSPLKGASGTATNAASTGKDTESKGDQNTHLEPAFRILDRLARVDTGRELIVKSGATDMLSSIMTVMTKNSALESLAMRVLAHLLGRNVSGLVDRLSGEVNGQVIGIRERVLAARLLASLMHEEENRRLLVKNDAALLLRILELLNEETLAASDASAPLVQVLASLAAGKTENIVILEDMNAPALVAYLMQNRMDDANVVAESANFFSSMIDCAEMVNVLEETTLEGSGTHTDPGEHSLLWLMIKAFSLNTHSDAAVVACLRFIELCLMYDYSPMTLVELGVIRFVTASMSSHNDDISIQVLATDVLCGLADRVDHINEMIGQNILGQIITNLRNEGKHPDAAGGKDGKDNSTTGGSNASAPSSTEDEEDTTAAANTHGMDAKLAHELSNQLVASSLYLITSICLVGKHVKLAKDVGIIRAVLAGFSRHSQDPTVYRNFRDVVSALNIEEGEVTTAIRVVSSLVAKLQIAASAGDPEALRFMTEYMNSLAAEGRVLPTGEAEGGDESMAGLTDRILEAISLLEAVTVSPVFVCVIVANEGVPVLTRTAGVVSAVKMVAVAKQGYISSAGSAAQALLAAKRGTNSGASNATNTKAVPYHLADEVLSRTCNTLAHIGRVAYELACGQVAHDSEYEDVDYEEFGIEEDLYRTENIGALCKAVTNGAKHQLHSFARDSTTLISWLASGATATYVRDHVDILVTQQGIEACVAMLRAHQSSVEICTAVAGALSRIAGSNRGAIAIAQRGASRQIIRMLRAAAALRSPAGDALLLAFLQVLENCASGGNEAVDLLRKQNVVDAITECIDAGTATDFFKSDDEIAMGKSAGGDDGDENQDEGEYKTDDELRTEIDACIQAILSYLVGPELVRETVTLLETVAAELLDQTTDPSAPYHPKKPLRITKYERAMVIRAVLRLGLFAGTEAATNAGTYIMENGVSATVQIADAALTVARAFTASDGLSPHNNTMEQELAFILPSCIRTIKQVIASLPTESEDDTTEEVPGTTAAVAAIPMLITVLEEKAEYSDTALECLASLTSTKDLAAGQVASACDGRGITIVLDTLRYAFDASATNSVRDALWTLSYVAKLPDCLPLCVLAGVPAIALAILCDSVADAPPDQLAANICLLAYAAVEPQVIPDLIDGGIFEVLRTTLQRHCSDAYNPNEPVLYACSLLMKQLATDTTVVNDENGRGEEFRNTFQRIIKAAAGSTGYLDESRCMVQMLELITIACTESSLVPAATVELNKNAAVEAEAEDTIVLAMSSSAADDQVLAAGSLAMAAIGSAQRGAQLLEEIDSFSTSIGDWLEAGWEATAPEVIDQVVDMTDRMRALGSNIVASSSKSVSTSFPELGNTYSEVLNTIWRAVHAVCRDDMASVRAIEGTQVSVGTAGKDLHQARADALALGAQIAGRLVQVSHRAEATEGSEGTHVIPVADAISMLSTVCYAARPAMEVRVLESMCRALDATLELKGGVCLPTMSSTGVIQSLTLILTTIQTELTKADSNTGGGPVADDELLLPYEDLERGQNILLTTLKNTTSKARNTWKEGTQADIEMITTDTSVIVEVLQASAFITSIETTDTDMNTGTASNVATTEGSGTLPNTAADDRSSDIFITVDAAVAGSVRMQATALANTPFIVLDNIAKAIRTSLLGPAKHAGQGRASVASVTDISLNVRVSATLIRCLNQRLSAAVAADANALTITIPASLERLLPVLDALHELTHISFPSGRKWEKFATTYLSGNKPKDNEFENDPLPPLPPPVEGAEPSPDEDYGEPVDILAIWSSASALAAGSLRSTFELLSRMDIGSPLTLTTVETNGTTVAVLSRIAAILAIMVQASVPADRSTAVAAARALARLSDIMANDILQSGKGTVSRPSADILQSRKQRITALGGTGIYKTALLACTSTGNTEPLPSNEAYIQEIMAMLATVSRFEGIDVKSLGLDKQCLTAAQALVRKYASNTVIMSTGQALVTVLENIYQEQSGAAFEATSKKALGAFNDMAQSAFHRHVSADGQLFYSKLDSDDSQWEPPAEINAAMVELMNVDRMSRVLEDEAVTQVAPVVIEGMVAALEAHAHDPGVVGVLLGALGKLAANPENHDALEACGALDKIVANIREHEHMNDPRISESLAALVLPLSFDPFLVKNMLGPSNVAPLLIEIARKYSNHQTSFVGSDLAWLPENVPDHNKRLHEIRAMDSTEAEEKNKFSPRIAQCCAQSLANLACDNEIDPQTGASTVDTLVQSGAIEVLGNLLRQHTENPRLLEDSICGLSNMAYVSDAIQLNIGRTCMDSVCSACTRYNGDAYLFQMTLRAIGNLTRTDENIVRAVGYGVFRGMIEGMTKHKENPEVLKLCADVIGNMASIDDRKLPREIGIGILKECITKAAANVSSSSGIVPPPPSSPLSSSSTAVVPPPLSPRPPPPPSGSTDMIALVESCDNIKYAVCSLLYNDGGARVLIDSMLAHPSRPELAASCLRALHYISSSPDLTVKMVEGLSLASHVVYIMQANDTSEDVLRRGARILGGIAGMEKLAFRVVDARAAPALLTAIQNHLGNREVCFLCYSVLTLLRGPAVTTAVREVRALETTIGLFRRCLSEGDVEFYAVLLELMLSFATETDMARNLAHRGASALVLLLTSIARAGAHISGEIDQITLFSYVLSILSALVKAGPEATDPLLTAGITGSIVTTVEKVLQTRDSRILLNRDARRSVLNCVAILADIIHPLLIPGEEAPLIPLNVEAAERIITENGAQILEHIYSVYKGIPDINNPNSLLFDANTCKAVTNVLLDLERCGYTITVDLGIETTGVGGTTTGTSNNSSSSSSSSSNETNRDGPPPSSSKPSTNVAASSRTPAKVPPPSVTESKGTKKGIEETLLGTKEHKHKFDEEEEACIAPLVTDGVPCVLWSSDGKSRNVILRISADYEWLIAQFSDGKAVAGEISEVPLISIGMIRMGNPPHLKKKMFGLGKTARPEKSIYLEDGRGSFLMHLEMEQDTNRETTSIAISAISGIDRTIVHHH